MVCLELKCKFENLKSAVFFLASLLILGSLIGALTCGFQSQYLGRVKSIAIDNLMFIGSGLILTLSPNFIGLIVGRLISGCACASSLAIVPVYVSEICNPKARAFTTSLVSIGFYVGIGVMSMLGAVFPWREAVALASIWPLFTLAGLIFCPETPVWLLKNKNKEKVLECLELLNDGSASAKFEYEELNNFHSISDEHKQSCFENVKKLVTNTSYFKPFFICLCMIIFGIELSSSSAFAYYFVKIAQVCLYCTLD